MQSKRKNKEVDPVIHKQKVEGMKRFKAAYDAAKKSGTVEVIATKKIPASS